MKRVLLSLVLLLCALGLIFWLLKKQEVKPALLNFSEITDLRKKQDSSVETVGNWQVKLHQAPASKKTEDSQTPASLSEILEDDQVCELVRSKFNHKEQILALTESSNEQSHSEMDQIVSILFGTSQPIKVNGESRNISSDILEFYNALLYADLLSGNFSQAPDLDEAHQILLNLSRRNHTNGAFPYFDAAVLEKAGASRVEVKQKFLESFSRSGFETYYVMIARHVMKKGLVNGSSFLNAIEFTSSMPIPNLSVPYQILKSFLQEKDAEFNRQAVEFGEKLLRPGIDSGGRNEFYTWSALQHLIGSSILEAAWKDAYPEKPVPKIKSYRELTEKVQPDEEFVDAWRDLNGEVCNREKFDQAFPRMRSKMLQDFDKVELKVQ